ncbi:hypothetical protein M5J15_16115 [Serratia symbiotica]|uniref:hypothetical protein n=1 Tax=Serratia symbiotica TaxID=138074 RepID=UPI001DDBC2E1|nr:hypothetical protein [Serratia symbiotica]NIG87729.1 hypothetical protein [Serratia symbiotica]USS95724.1 hypothetical protein M5J15_16115 [Serratia symbiotica]
MLDELIDNARWLWMMSVLKRNLLYWRQDRKGEMHRLGSCINGSASIDQSAISRWSLRD